MFQNYCKSLQFVNNPTKENLNSNAVSGYITLHYSVTERVKVKVHRCLYKVHDNSKIKIVVFIFRHVYYSIDNGWQVTVKIVVFTFRHVDDSIGNGWQVTIKIAGKP